MEWFKKHTDAFMTMGAILGAMVWMNGEFNDVKRQIGDVRIDMAVVKTVLIMKNVMPKEVAQKD
jgi:hypothetical protein